MLKGLIIGKFMPLTKGHIGLIDFGAANCDHLIVAVCTLKSEPIEGNLRYNWVKKYYGNNKKVEVVHVTKELPSSSESVRELSKLWTGYLKEAFPEVNVIFSSEPYGKYVAEYMNADYKLFDVDRKSIPISATKIRGNPFKYWEFIPDIVKPYFVKRVCVYGPDSFDKNTLTMDLAKHYKTAYVPELTRNSRKMFKWSHLQIENLNIGQLEQLARLQSETVKAMTHFANKLLFCDSDNLTTQIYSEVYFGQVTEDITKYNDIHYDLYLLLDIDTPYFKEGKRNLGNTSREMFERFKGELDKRNLKYVLISGAPEEIFNKAVEAIEHTIL